MGILSRILSKWFMPRKNAKLAKFLVEFLQTLKMNAFVEKGLGDELIEASNRDRKLGDFAPRDLGFSQQTIYYICNVIFES